MYDAVVFGAAASNFAALQACDDIERAFQNGADWFGFSEALPDEE